MHFNIPYLFLFVCGVYTVVPVVLTFVPVVYRKLVKVRVRDFDGIQVLQSISLKRCILNYSTRNTMYSEIRLIVCTNLFTKKFLVNMKTLMRSPNAGHHSRFGSFLIVSVFRMAMAFTFHAQENVLNCSMIKVSSTTSSK